MRHKAEQPRCRVMIMCLLVTFSHARPAPPYIPGKADELVALFNPVERLALSCAIPPRLTIYSSKDNVSFQGICKRNNLKRITHDTTWTTTLGLPVLFRCIIPLSNGKMIGTLSPSSPSCVRLTTDRSCLGPSFCPIPQNPGSSCCLFLVSVSLEVYCRAACSQHRS